MCSMISRPHTLHAPHNESHVSFDWVRSPSDLHSSRHARAKCINTALPRCRGDVQLYMLPQLNLDCGLSHSKMSSLTCCCHSGIRANKGSVQHTGSSSQGQDNLAGVSRGHTFNPLGNSQRPTPRRAQNAWAEHRGAEIAAFWHLVTVRHLPESRQDRLPQESCRKSSQSYR